MQKSKNEFKDTFTEYDENFNYEDENAEAVVYFINHSGKNTKPNLFVMKRSDAVKLCSSKKTKGANWALCFSTHKRNWRNELKFFRKDDGRFDELIKSLNIKIIFSLK